MLAQTPDGGVIAAPVEELVVVDAGAPPAPAPPPLKAPPIPVGESPANDAGVAVPHEAKPVPENDGKAKVSLAAEAAFEVFPSGTAGGANDTLFDLTPMLGFFVGDEFAAIAGAQFRLRLFDNPPDNRSRDFGGVLRREDWDEASDFGQIIRLLKIGKLDDVAWLRGGPTTTKTLGLGHVINRYGNRDNPNYHPASGNAGLNIGPVRTEFFASDVFGGRLLAGDVGVEFGRIFSNDQKWWDRFHLVLSLAHDLARAGNGGVAVAPVTILNLDFDAVLYKGAQARVMVLTGVGTRFGNGLGAVLGLAADAELDGGFVLGGKLEGRKQGGGYRQGFFGPGYELSRFAGTGFSGLPLAAEQLPDSFSFYGELRVGSRGTAMFEAMIEHWVWGRTDLDSTFSLTVWDERIIGSARFTAIGMGQLPRYSVGGKLSVRILPALYLLTEGGTVFFPQSDGTLARGWYASLGAGADFEKSF